jgi:uncharacterized glyoxalase superfamily protein PhnB
MPAQTIFPALRCHDPDAALTWLTDAFGAKEKTLHRDDHGKIRHAELRLGENLIMFGQYGADGFLGGSAPNPRAGTISLYIAITDPDEHYERARLAHAEVVRELVDTDYGSREYSVRDLEGNLWSFGTSMAVRRSGSRSTGAVRSAALRSDGHLLRCPIDLPLETSFPHEQTAATGPRTALSPAIRG